MPYNESLADRVHRLLSRRRNLTIKKMFGGLGFMLNGNMCCGVWKEFLILRLGPKQGESALEEPHVRPFDITGKAMKGWVMVEPPSVESAEDLKQWVQLAARFSAALPAKD